MSQTAQPPQISDLVRHLFAPAVRTRGAKYARQGRVAIAAHTQTFVQARVAGTRKYDVLVRLGPGLSDTKTACNCPYHTDRGPCKHVWATLLVAEQLGYLSVDGFLDEEDDLDDDFLDAGFDDDEEFPAPTFPRPYIQQRWRNVMTSLQQVTTRHRHDRQLADHELRYVLKVEDTLHGAGKIWIDVQSRRPRKDGRNWTLFKPLRITEDEARGLTDPVDREIMTLLAGCTQSSYGFHGFRTQNTAFGMSPALADHLLPAIAGTGRFGFAIDDSAGDYTPVTLDEGPAWKVEIAVVPNDAAHGYDAKGLLVRDGEQMDISAPVLLLDAGWVLTHSSMARLDHGGAFPWVMALRSGDLLHIPKTEVDLWLPELLKCRVRPPITVPKELEWHELTGTLKPIMRISRPMYRANRGILGGIVTFLYGETEFEISDERCSVFDPRTRLLMVRDTAAEDNLFNSLQKLGFYPPQYAYTHTYRNAVNVEILLRDFGNAVRELSRTGWDVEAEGARCRPQGSVSISVRSSGIDWFEVDGLVQFDGAEVSLPKVLEALRDGEAMVRLDDGTMGILPEDWLKRYGMLARAGSESQDTIRFTRSQGALLDALLAAEPDVDCDETFSRLREELREFRTIEPKPAPPGFHGTLREYQREGFGWLTFLQRFGFGGCLADDMGLGKTVQALAMLESERRAKHGPSLVIVPKSIVLNWVSEAQRFAPELRVVNHTGLGRARAPGGFPEVDVVLTTYGTMRQDIEWLKDVEFNWLILDEAQAIKNAGTITAKAARLLQGRHRLAMSGTPIENHLGELWSLFEFLNPGMLGASSVFSEISRTSGVDEDAGLRELLARALRPFILRRTKQQVATDLPDKVEETIFCELPVAQRKVYDEIRDYYRRSLKAKVEESGLNRSKIMVLEALLRLRQAACHPGLLDRSRSRQSSGKLELLLEQIDDVVQEGHKMLIFSQFTSLLAIVRSRLDSRGIVYEYLDGKTHKRAERVARFQSDPECSLFLISLKAGGLGLNLTAADYVVLLDPWWNPAVEAQAIDRTHRIGQTRKVFAYRLVAKDTVEERILELQKTKKQLADSIITADNSLIRDLKREDLDLLLS